jgi:hypothetical protein
MTTRKASATATAKSKCGINGKKQVAAAKK